MWRPMQLGSSHFRNPNWHFFSSEQIDESLIDSKKILIGFSKGVVVLNQILHEISVLQGNWQQAEDELPHPVYRIALRFSNDYLGWLYQGKYFKNATQRGKRLRKRRV